jgi:hypothetical protein
MRTRTITVREGEWLGPVDWSYDFGKHSWDRRGGCVNPEAVKEGELALRILADAYADSMKPAGWEYDTDDRTDPKPQPAKWRYSPSFLASFEIVFVGMYDGWPFWEPTPAIGYVGPLGRIEVEFFYKLRKEQLIPPKG